MIDKEDVYIIIPVYNRKQTTLACLERLKQSGDLQKKHVLVVDDGSTDGTALAIEQSYPEAEMLTGNGDLWWTGAMALGMEYASNQKAQSLIWLNDDCIPELGVLSEMVQFMRDHPDTLVAPACYAEQSGSLKIINNGFQGRQKVEATLNKITYVEGMSGWCVGIPMAVVQKIGLPDAQRFPHYSGDNMYTLKATRAGFKACLNGKLSATLVGPVRETLDLKNYVRPGATFANTLYALFWHKKSPYRLPTRFFYFTERYGLVMGFILFLIKTFMWIEQWMNLQFKVWRSELSKAEN